MPVRIQLSRAKGWRMPPNTVKVDRTTVWGNQFKVLAGGDRGWEVYMCVGGLSGPAAGWYPTRVEALAASVRHHRNWLEGPNGDLILIRARRELGGVNLGCWCAIGAPCHADAWLEVANGVPEDGA